MHCLIDVLPDESGHKSVVTLVDKDGRLRLVSTIKHPDPEVALAVAHAEMIAKFGTPTSAGHYRHNRGMKSYYYWDEGKQEFIDVTIPRDETDIAAFVNGRRP